MLEDLVSFRGKHSDQFSIRGVVEVIATDSFVKEHSLDGKWGIRLENGNFRWAADDQIKPRAEKRK
jgi:hypothetical protein